MIFLKSEHDLHSCRRLRNPKKDVGVHKRAKGTEKRCILLIQEIWRFSAEIVGCRARAFHQNPNETLRIELPKVLLLTSTWATQFHDSESTQRTKTGVDHVAGYKVYEIPKNSKENRTLLKLSAVTSVALQ